MVMFGGTGSTTAVCCLPGAAHWFVFPPACMRPRMSQWITSAKLIVLSGFILVSAATAWYEVAYVWPVKRCDARGAWWDYRDRQCLVPIPLWRITGRGLVPAAVAAGQPTSPRARL